MFTFLAFFHRRPPPTRTDPSSIRLHDSSSPRLQGKIDYRSPVGNSTEIVFSLTALSASSARGFTSGRIVNALT